MPSALLRGLPLHVERPLPWALGQIVFRAIFAAMLATLLTGCEQSTYEYPDRRYGVRFDAEYFEKLQACEKRPTKVFPRHVSLDYGRKVQVIGRPAEWYSKPKFLGDTCYQASIGPNVYKDEDNDAPDFYSIDVEIKAESPGAPGGYTWAVVFERQFPIAELPEGFLYKSVHEVVSFDPLANTVVFAIGEEEYEYSLP